MKKCLYLLLALTAVVSCAPQEMELPFSIQSGEELTLKAYFEDSSTKSTLVDETKVYWLPGDEISVFAGSSSARFSTGIKEKSAECDFTGKIEAAEKYYAFYPYSSGVSCDGNYIKATLPSEQKATEGNVTNGYLLSAGVSSKNGTIAFRNLPGGICFSLKSEGVRYVELKGKGDEAIAGEIRVKLDDKSVKTEVTSGTSVIRLTAPDGGTFKPGVSYYIVCVPTVFKKGLTLEMFKDDDVSAVFSIDRSVELKRSIFGRIDLADDGIEYKGGGFPEGELPPDNEIWYTTIDNKPLTSEINVQGGQSVVSHTFSKGMGVLRFSGPVTRCDQIVIPIDGSAIDDVGRLTGVLLPDCVETIGEGFFRFVGKVREFRIPAALKRIVPGALAYNGKSALERFTGHHISKDGRCLIIDDVMLAIAPAGLSSYEIPSGVVTIAEGACALAEDLKSVVLPSSVLNLEQFAFTNCGIESVTIPSSVKAIHVYAFKGCRQLRNLVGDSPFISKDRKFLYDADSMIPMMLFFFAGRDDDSYEIPEGIMAIENYAFEGCDKLKSLTFPKSLGFIGGNAFEGCDKLEALYGHHVTSDNKGFINDSNCLQFLVPGISDDYVVPDEVTAIGDQVFASRPTLRSVTMGDQVTELGNYVFAYSWALKTITLSANLVTVGYNPFMFCSSLEAVYFRSIVPPTCSAVDATETPLLKFYVPSQSYKIYTSDTSWKKYWNDMQPYDYKDLPKPDYYVSSDYSKEGEVTVYQKASEGNGIDLVFMGDAYSDREVAGGKYLGDMKACVEQFFQVEPYKSFRKLFNIYIVTAVSATEGYEHGGRSLGTVRGIGTYISGNDAKCFDLARQAVKEDGRMEEVLVIVCCNQNLSGTVYMSGTCFFYDPEVWEGHDYACGPAVTYFLKEDESFEKTGKTIRHEAGGHGFGKLADEYHYSGNVSVNDKELIQNRTPYRWYSNVDITSDPAKIKWSAFLSDSRYKNEVGVFEGGFTYQYGVWRPSENSIMNDNEGGFNAPSRYTIWYRINKLAYGERWNGTYEDFAKYDAVNRSTTKASGASAPAGSVGRQQQTAAPVVTGRTWREAVPVCW